VAVIFRWWMTRAVKIYSKLNKICTCQLQNLWNEETQVCYTNCIVEIRQLTKKFCTLTDGIYSKVTAIFRRWKSKPSRNIQQIKQTLHLWTVEFVKQAIAYGEILMCSYNLRWQCAELSKAAAGAERLKRHFIEHQGSVSRVVAEGK